VGYHRFLRLCEGALRSARSRGDLGNIMRLHESLSVLGAAALVVGLGIGGCGDDERPPQVVTGGTGGNGAGGGGTGADGGSGGGPPIDMCLMSHLQQCNPPEPAHAAVPIDVANVTAAMIDQNGLPAADMIADLCGTNICKLFGHTDAAGLFDETSPGGDPVPLDALLLYGDGVTFSKMGVVLDGSASQALGTVSAIRLPPVAQGAAFCSGAEATSNGVTISVPEGASLHVDKLVYDETMRGFRAAVVEAVDMTHPDLPDNIELVVGTAPIDTLICPGATMTFPNTLGWAEGTAVHVYLYGSMIFDHTVPYGAWGQISTATVTADGIVTDDGEEIGVLGVFGLDPQL
jgi:hypothetical protein